MSGLSPDSSSALIRGCRSIVENRSLAADASLANDATCAEMCVMDEDAMMIEKRNLDYYHFFCITGGLLTFTHIMMTLGPMISSGSILARPQEHNE